MQSGNGINQFAEEISPDTRINNYSGRDRREFNTSYSHPKGEAKTDWCSGKAEEEIRGGLMYHRIADGIVCPNAEREGADGGAGVALLVFS